MLHTEDPQGPGATVQNAVVRDLCILGLCNSFNFIFLNNVSQHGENVREFLLARIGLQS